MYPSTITFSAALFASAVLAAPTARGYEPNTFQLQVRGIDETGTSGTPTAAFHSGAAIEALVVPPTGVEYETNSTEFNAQYIPSISDAAYINYRPEPNANDTALQLYNNGTSNENFLFFGGAGDGPQIFTFTQTQTEGTMQVGVYVNSSSTQYEFYICPEENLGYTYDTVTWVKDFATPADTQCREVVMFSVPYPY